jgi:hypothetical protein
LVPTTDAAVALAPVPLAALEIKVGVRVKTALFAVASIVAVITPLAQVSEAT